MSETPETLGACADRLYSIGQAQTELKRQIDVLDRERRELEAKLIDELPKSDARGVLGNYARAKVVVKEVPTAQDWDALWEHIKETGEFDLVQRRLASGAIKARWDDGEEIPGVGKYNAVSLSITKG